MTAIDISHASSRWGEVLRRLGRRSTLPILFLLLVTPTVLIQVFLTPPIQVADEENHFIRASQILEGELFGRMIPGNGAGGHVDPEIPVFAHGFDAMKFHPEVKVDLNAFAAMARLHWNSGPALPAAFLNTAVYPFFLYIPASAGLAAGRATGLSLMHSFYLGRLVTALCSVALAAAALWLCGQGRTFLFLILSFPMTTSLLASMSQDAMSIALGAIAAALWARSVARREAMPVWARAITALALGAVIAARLPLAPLYVLALMPTRPPARLGLPRRADVAAALVGLIPLAIGIYGAHAAKVPFKAGEGVSPSAQLAWMFAHPISAARAVLRTVALDGQRHMHDMVGVLGWLDTNLPQRFYGTVGLCVVLGILVDVLKPRVFLPRWGWLPLAAFVLTTTGVFIALYLAWTPVGAPIVDGVQGRYFMVPALVLAVALPGLGRSLGPRVSHGLDIAQVALCVAVAMMELWIVPTTIIHRYYG